MLSDIFQSTRGAQHLSFYPLGFLTSAVVHSNNQVWPVHASTLGRHFFFYLGGHSGINVHRMVDSHDLFFL